KDARLLNERAIRRAGAVVRARGCLLHAETTHRAVSIAGTAYIPSTRIMFVLAVRCRILRGSRYSSQFSQALARSADSNCSTTTRFGFQSPSSTSVLPPRTTYFQPHYSTTALPSFF